MYIAKENRYEKMTYNCCGRSGLKLPALSLGMWHNFGSVNDVENMKKILFTALIMELHILILPIIMVLSMEVRKQIWEES